MTTDVLIEDDRWAAHDIAALAPRAVDATLAHLGLASGDWEVAVLATSDARIVAFNTAFRDRPVPTNILSWPSEDRAPPTPGTTPAPPAGDGALGDMALAFETCAREAAEADIALRDHLLHLVVHGTLHLLGYDHERDAEADLMEATEIAILHGLGVPDPYRR